MNRPVQGKHRMNCDDQNKMDRKLYHIFVITKEIVTHARPIQHSLQYHQWHHDAKHHYLYGLKVIQLYLSLPLANQVFVKEKNVEK